MEINKDRIQSQINLIENNFQALKENRPHSATDVWPRWSRRLTYIIFNCAAILVAISGIVFGQAPGGIMLGAIILSAVYYWKYTNEKNTYVPQSSWSVRQNLEVLQPASKIYPDIKNYYTQTMAELDEFDLFQVSLDELCDKRFKVYRALTILLTIISIILLFLYC